MNADSKLYAQIKDDELVLCFHVLYIFFFFICNSANGKTVAAIRYLTICIWKWHSCIIYPLEDYAARHVLCIYKRHHRHIPKHQQ